MCVSSRYAGKPPIIVDFPTRRHWEGKFRTEDIESGWLAPRTVVKAEYFAPVLNHRWENDAAEVVVACRSNSEQSEVWEFFRQTPPEIAHRVAASQLDLS